MTDTIFDVLNRNAVSKFKTRYDGEFGVEIETETKKPYEEPKSRFWDVKIDGSLRDFGREYVLKGPMSNRELELALTEFGEFNKLFKFTTDSVSTSVHVHINMLNESWITLANFFTAYTLMENLLIRHSGPDRVSNLFCLPICDAKGVSEGLNSILKSLSNLQYRGLILDPHRVKYGAINPEPLVKLGTVEIRSFRGATDVNTIAEWIDILRTLKAYCKTPGLDPIKILNQYQKREHRLVNDIFPEHSARLTRGLTDKQVDEMICGRSHTNLITASKLAATVKDWENFGMPKPKKVTKAYYKQALDEIAMEIWNEKYDALQYHRRLIVEDRYMARNPNARTVGADEDM